MSSVREVTIKYLADGSQAKSESKAVSQEIDNVAKAAKGSANVTSAANDNVAKSMKNATIEAQKERVVFDDNAAAAKRWNVAINEGAQRLAVLQNEIARVNRELKQEFDLLERQKNQLALATDPKAFIRQTDAIQKTEQQIGLLATQKAALGAEAQRLQSSMSNVGQKTEIASNIFNTFTTRINTGRGILAGYDAIIEAVARSFGGITVAAAIAIQILSALATVIFRNKNAKEDELRLEKEVLVVQEQRLRQTEREAGMRGKVTDSILKQVQAQKQVFDAIFLKAVDDVIVKYTELEDKQKQISAEQNQGAKRQATLGGEYAKARQELNPLLDVLTEYQTITGKSSIEVIQHARELGKQTDQTDRLTRALSLVNPQINQFGGIVERVTVRIQGATIATREFNEELAKLRIPSLDVSTTTFGRDELRAKIEKRIEDQSSDRTDRTEAFKANLPALREYVDKTADAVKAEAALNNQKVTQAELNRRVNSALATGSDEFQRQVQAAQRLDDVVQKTHRGGAAAARSHALATNELTTAIKEAEAALEADSFTRREKMIRADIESERNKLAIKKQLNAQNEADLATLQELRLRKVETDRREAVRQVEADIAEIQTRGVLDDFDRRRRAITVEVEEKRRALMMMFGDEQLVADLIDRYKRARESEFLRWMLAEHQKTIKEVAAEAMRIERDRMEEMENDLDRFLKTQLDAWEKQQDKIIRLAKQFEKSGGGVPDIADVERISKLMEKYGLSVDKVSRAFGFASRNIRIFELQLRAMQRLSRGNILGGLADSIRAIGLEFITAGGLAQAWSEAIIGAFDATINGGASFLESFGKLLIGGMLQIFGQMAMISGAYHIKEGIARMATLWDFAGGLKEFIAGTALLALGAAMGAAGGAIANSGRGSAGAGGGGGGSSAGAGSNAPDPSGGRGPRRIEFNTSGHSNLSPDEASRVTALDRQIAHLESIIERGGGGLFRNILPRLLQRLEAERAQLLRHTQSTVAAFESANRAINVRQSDQPNVPSTVVIKLGESGAKKFLTELMDGEGVVTTKNAKGKYRPVLKQALGV